MNTSDETFTLDELADHTGMEPRTIRNYVSKGLIPRPSRGRGARYEGSTLDRLLAIKHMMSETGCSLEYCRRILAGMDDENIAEVVNRQPQELVQVENMKLVQQVTAHCLESKIHEPIETKCLAEHSQAKTADSVQITGGETWIVVPICADLVVHIRDDSKEITPAAGEQIIEGVRALVAKHKNK